jgi:glycosyltransferase involved in cell wall biosynthesis
LERNKILNIAALFENAFPVGYAEANRLLSISQGIAELGHRIKVYCIRPADRPPNVLNKEEVGIIDGVEYIYPAKTTIWPDKKVKRIFIYLKGMILTLKTLRQDYKKKKIDVIISYSYSVIINNVFGIFSRMYKIKFSYFVDEYPYSILYPNKYGTLYKWYELNHFYKIFDNFLVMTTPLKDFYSERAKPGANIVVVPMTVQPKRFENVSDKSPFQQPYFAYAGYLGDDKDGVDILLKAFSIVSKEYENVLLVLIGYSNNQEHHDKLNDITKESNIEDKVIFTGRIHRDEIPHYFNNAIGLVLARPDNIQAKGGFPTKLGEYLATGKPVVVTKVGEIPFYLKDQRNAFLAEPNNIESFAQKMIELLKDQENAIQIGKQGKKLTKEVFNYKVQAGRILEFLKQ